VAINYENIKQASQKLVSSKFSDEELEKFLKSNSTADVPEKKAYDLERSDPISTLKQMIRERHTANDLDHKPIAVAQILKVESNLQSYYDAVNPQQDTESKYVLARFRVLSDRRHFWLPEPKNFNDDKIISLYPLVKKELPSGEAAPTLNVGDIVTVQFENKTEQYSAFYEVATVLNTVGNNGKLLSGELTSRCADIKLPPLPKDSNAESLIKDPCLILGNVSNFNMQDVKKEAEKNKKQIVFPKFPVPSGYSKMSNWGQVRRKSDGTTRRHWGIDYDLTMNAEVVAALDGKVVRAITQKNRSGKITGYGNYIVLEHTIYSKELNADPVRFYTLYAHLGNNNGKKGFSVSGGQYVKRGQKIGEGGNSGTSVSGRGGDGSHLHFEFLDPPSGQGLNYCLTPANKRKVSKDAETEFFRRGFYIDTPEGTREKKLKAKRKPKAVQERRNDDSEGGGF
jgi:murein DD-endopeptidase MepM/ murein hydrolase activator NlpD